MATRREQKDNQKRFKEAQREAKKTGQTVAGTLRNGVPVYFVVPAGASEDLMDEAAFLAVNGRQRNDSERWLARMAKVNDLEVSA